MGRGAGSDPYRRLFETMVDGAVVLDAATGRVVLGNRSAARILGFSSPDALVGLDPMDFVPREGRQAVRRLLAESGEQDQGPPVEIRLITADKREAWVSARATAMDHRGRRAILATMRDITLDQARGVSACNGDRQYEYLFDRMLDGAVVLDVATFKIVWASIAAATMFGFATPQEAVGQNPLDYIPPEDRDSVIQRVAANLEGTDKNPSEWRMITANKREIWISASAAEIEYEGRQAVVATMRDITREKARDAALREAEVRYGLLFDRMIDGALMLDIATFKVALANRAAAAMFGFASPEEMIGKNPLDYIPQEDHSRIVHMIATNIEGKHKDPAELQVITADGRRLWISATATEVHHEGRAAVITTMRDVTADKAKDAALRVAEESKMQLIEAAGEAIFVIQDGKVAYVNPAGARGAGLSQEALIGIPFLDMVHPDDRQEVVERYEKLTAGQSFPGLFMARGITSRGEPRWSNVQEIPYLWQGRPAVMSLVSDVTDRVLAEQSLKEEEERLRAIMENAWDGVAIFDRDFGVIFESPSLATMTGYSPEEWTGITPEKFQVHPEDLPSMLAQLESLKGLPGAVIQDVVIRYRHRDGSWRTMEATGRNLLDDPKVRGMVINFRDITERRKAEESLRQSEALLRSTQELAMVGGWDFDVVRNQAHWTDETYRIHEIPNLPDIDHLAESLKCFPPMDRQAVREAFQKCVDEGAPFDLVVPFMTFKGNRRWVRVTAKAVREGDRTVRVLGNIADITERKSAEERMLASEERYRKVVETASEAIAVLQDGVIKFANPRTAAVSGYSIAELTLKPFLELVHPDDRQMVADYYVTQQKGRESPGTYQFRFVDKSGRTGWAEANVTLLIWDGRLATLLLMNIITERKMIEEALKDREARYRLLAENASDVIWMVDTGLRLTYVSPSAFGLLGYTPEEMMDQPLDRLLGLESLNAMAELHLRGMASEDQHQGTLREETAEVEVVRKDGSRVWLETGIKVVRDLEGRVAGFQGACRDISQRREAEAALKASEERFRTLIEESTDAIAILDATGKVLYQSRSVTQVTGYPSEEWAGSPVPDWFFHPDDIPAAAAAYKQVLKEPNATLPGLMARFKHADGTWHTLEATVRNLLHDPKVNGLVINYRDVTERVKSQEALQASEANYKSLFEATLLGTEVIDAETGKVVLANTAVARIFGLGSAEEAIGLTPMEYILPEDRDWVAEQMAAAVVDPGKRDVPTIRSRTLDGRVVWLTATASSFEYHGRQAILVSMIDVTAMKEAEARLRESEEKNRLLIENAAEAIAVIQDGATRFFNRRLIELTGCSEEELYRTSLVDLVHAEDREMVALDYSNRVAGIPTSNNHQFRIVDRQGQTRWLQVSSVRLNWENRPAALSMFSDVTERVKAEQALRDSEERFRALIEKASDAIMIIDTEARVVYWSPSITQATGYQFDDWMGKSPADWKLHPDDLVVIMGLLGQVLEKPGDSIDNLRVRYMHKDGTWHTLEAMVRNMFHDPKINGIVANFRDITERVKAEQAVRDSEERYRLLAENVSDVIWVIDMNMKPTYISPSAQRMLGYSSEQFMRGSIESMLTRESARVALKAFSKALSRESEQPGVPWEPPPLDLQFIRADGTTIWTAANFSYIRGSDGKPVAMLGVLKDITERKKAEDLLRRSEERFRSLVETSSDWVWEVDVNNRYTYVSPKVRDILGHEPQDLLGRTPFDLMHQREGRRVSKIMRRFAAERLPFSLLENTTTHKDGRGVVLESSAVPIMDGSGRLSGYRGINRDITERKKVEQELQRSLRRLEKTMESTIEAITTTIETRDPYTTGHQMRVTDLACAIAKVMEIPPGKIEGIRVAGLLHDIGKIAIPTEILSKPGKLNEVEYEMIKTHAKIGYNILKKIEFPWPVARAVLQHHERWNGSGYPYGIRGEDILLEARILAVADVMEAMSSHRPYRPSIGADKALDEIAKNSGTLYDPAVASACVAAFSESGFEFSATLPGTTAEADVAPSERHIRYSLEDH